MSENNIQSPQILKLASLDDLIRLIISRLDRNNKSGYLYYGNKDGKHILMIQHLVPSWYQLRGLPVSIIAYSEEAPKSNLIRYKFASDVEPESWEFVDEIKTNPNLAHIPIIRVESFPNFMM